MNLAGRIARRARYAGLRHRCPSCRARLRAFERYSPVGLQCPRCGARDRHRLLALYLETASPVARAHPRVLHVSPEPSIRMVLDRLAPSSYVSVDLDPGAAELTADVTDLPMATASSDLVICSHVLEHVPDDGLALAELARVVAAGGEVVLLTPLNHGLAATIEDPRAPTAERRRRFGQEDHVRIYGRDLADRIRAAGLVPRTFDADDVDAGSRARAGLGRDFGAHGLRNELFACSPADQTGGATPTRSWRAASTIRRAPRGSPREPR